MAVPMEPGSDCSDASKCEGACGKPFEITYLGTTITVPICCMGELRISHYEETPMQYTEKFWL